MAVDVGSTSLYIKVLVDLLNYLKASFSFSFFLKKKKKFDHFIYVGEPGALCVHVPMFCQLARVAEYADCCKLSPIM